MALAYISRLATRMRRTRKKEVRGREERSKCSSNIIIVVKSARYKCIGQVLTIFIHKHTPPHTETQTHHYSFKRK